MSTVTKQELIDRIARNTHFKTILVKTIIHEFLNEIVFELSQSNRIEFRDFGVFETRTRRPRKAQNPKTLESVQVPAKQIVKFKSGRLMKQKLNGKT